jgi:uncharacterized protein with HEPN domain
MASSSSAARLADIIEAIELIRAELAGMTIHAFETERRKQWLVERGLEIISEASRRLPEAMKAHSMVQGCRNRQHPSARLRAHRLRRVMARHA